MESASPFPDGLLPLAWRLLDTINEAGNAISSYVGWDMISEQDRRLSPAYEFHRLLEEARNVTDTGFNVEDVSNLTMLEVLKASMRVYGSVFAILFALFLVGRQYYRAAYNVLDSSPETRTPLSSSTYYGGWIDWTRRIYLPTDDELFNHCGMDAVAFVRTLRYGFRVACVGMVSSVFLMPSYALTGGTNTQLESVTMGNIPEMSHALLSATVACYIVFGAAMYMLYKEFAWFTRRRHIFLSWPRPDNYSIFVKHIPLDLRSDDALMEVFRRIYSHESVVDARVALDIPNLERAVAEREAVSSKLEHAINVLNVRGDRPRHRKNLFDEEGGCCCCTARKGAMSGETVDTIDSLTSDLNKRNDDVAKRIDEVYRFVHMGGPSFDENLEMTTEGSQLHQTVAQAEDKDGSLMAGRASATDAAATNGSTSTRLGEDGAAMYGSMSRSLEEPSLAMALDQNKDANEDFYDNEEEGEISVVAGATKNSSACCFNPFENTAKAVLDAATMTTKGALRGVEGAAYVATTGAKLASRLVMGADRDGMPRDAGFVSFSTLKAKASALQMLHHPVPYVMQASQAPLPKDVFWGNVGMPHKAQQVGKVVAFALTVVLCFFWTTLVSFVTALGEVDRLTQLLPFLKVWLVKAPWLNMFLSQLKPLLLVLIVSLLPPMLRSFSKREGHISEATLNASLFGKLSIFLLIQLFFVQIISGTIFQQIEEILKNTSRIITLLAEALPKQAQSFMQYVIVQTFLNIGLEMARIVPIIIAWVRSRFGPNLTEKERRTSWMGLTPISVPPEFDFADVQANLILYYMILFVYAVLSPITAFVMGGAFFLYSLCYRHQLFFVYSTKNDTGGQLFTRFTKLIVTCMIIAEVTVFGTISLKKGAIAAPALIPLIVATVFFSMYMKQQHYHVTDHLPSMMCVEEDLKNVGELDLDFLMGAYLQPAFQTPYVQPENLSTAEPSNDQDSMHFFTPPHSHVEAEEQAQSSGESGNG